MSSGTVYCYHCHTQHPREEMRLVVSKSGKRWRCIASIKAAQKSREEREAFGRKVSAMNKAEAQAKLKARTAFANQTALK
ncbi:MAG: hypothetical protein JNM90_23085 [Burkholderiales bacterium]|nr:hypothetical protein [Burkholderiales bacterium]